MRSQKPWIRCRATWPDFMFDHAAVAGDLADAYRMHGVIEGKARAIGLTPTSSMALEATAEEVVATAAIEGERLSMDSVRSSVMRRLGLAVTGQADRHIDGLVVVIDDAMNHYARPLDEDRLCRWQGLVCRVLHPMRDLRTTANRCLRPRKRLLHEDREGDFHHQCRRLGHRGRTNDSEPCFACVSPDDPSYQRANLRPDRGVNTIEHR